MDVSAIFSDEDSKEHENELLINNDINNDD